MIVDTSDEQDGMSTMHKARKAPRRVSDAASLPTESGPDPGTLTTLVIGIFFAQLRTWHAQEKHNYSEMAREEEVMQRSRACMHDRPMKDALRLRRSETIYLA